MIAAILLAAAFPIADLRVGEANGVVRVEVICGGPCAAEPGAGDGFLLLGVEERLVARPKITDVLERVELSPTSGGTLLVIATDLPVTASRKAECGPRTLCFDYGFNQRGTRGKESRTLRTALEDASGTSLGEASCAVANATLEADPWDLAAYRTVALCRAVEGRASEADGLLARLEAFAPDPVTTSARSIIRQGITR